MTVGPLPTGVPQLDGSPQANVNCGPATGAAGLSHANRNRAAPTPTEVRQAGQMAVGPTDLADMKRAVAAYANEFAAMGLSAPSLVRLGYIPFADFVATLVRPRYYHAVPIMYRVVTQHPEYAGDKNFTGAHFVGAVRIYEATAWDQAGNVSSFHRVRFHELQRVLDWLESPHGVTDQTFWTEVVDPLADGRRPAIPKAAQLWPLALLLQAGDDFNSSNATDGKLSAGIIDRAGGIGGH